MVSLIVFFFLFFFFRVCACVGRDCFRHLSELFSHLSKLFQSSQRIVLQLSLMALIQRNAEIVIS